MEQLKSMKEQLIAQVQAQLGNIHQANAEELGAAVDMIKDIAETEYYCSVVKAMEDKEEEKPVERYYYTERYMPIPYQRAAYERDMDRSYGKMYYEDQRSMSGRYYEDPRDMGGSDRPRYAGGEGGGNSGGSSGGGNSGGSSGGNSGGRSYYQYPYEMPMMMPMQLPARDMREGRSPSRRRMYMESKEMHQPKEKQMHELEAYMQELSSDITDMIHDAPPDERQMLQTKLQTLIAKIDQVK